MTGITGAAAGKKTRPLMVAPLSVSTCARGNAAVFALVPELPHPHRPPGAPQNLQRWTSTRSIKETFAPATDHRYPYMG